MTWIVDRVRDYEHCAVTLIYKAHEARDGGASAEAVALLVAEAQVNATLAVAYSNLKDE